MAAGHCTFGIDDWYDIAGQGSLYTVTLISIRQRHLVLFVATLA